MNKGIIAILSLAASVPNVIAFVGFGPAVATQLFGCQSSLYGPPATGCAAYPDSAVAIGTMLYLGGALAAPIAWILGLVRRGAAHPSTWNPTLRARWADNQGNSVDEP